MSSKSRSNKGQQGKHIACVTQAIPNGKINPQLTESQDENELRRWLRKVPDDPTEAACVAKALIGSSRMQFDNAKLFAAVVGYGAALQLVASDKLWRAFVADPAWAGFTGHKPKADIADEHLRWMMIFVFDAKDERGKDRANVYRGALQAKFDAGAKSDSIFAYIKEAGGIDAAYRQAPKTQKAQASNSVFDQSDDCQSDSKLPPKNDGIETKKDEKNLSERAANVKEKRLARARFSAKSKEVENDGFVPWIVSIRPHDVKGKIQRYLQVGKVTLDCTLRSDPDGWVEAVCIGIRHS